MKIPKLKLKKKKKSASWDKLEMPRHLKEAKIEAARPKPITDPVPNLPRNKKHKKATAAFLAEKADDWGEKYASFTDQAAQAKKSADSINEQIKILAAKHGTTDGKVTAIKGKNFMIGFQTTEPTPSADPSLCLKHLPRKVYARVASMKAVINEKELEACVDEGLIDAKMLAKVCVTNGSAQKRIYVRPL